MKLQGIFVSYLLLPLIILILACVVLMFNKANKHLDNKRLIIFTLISSLIIAIPGVFTLTGTSFMPVYYFLIQFCFLVMGYFYMLKVESFFASGDEILDKSMVILTSAVILCLGSYLFSLLFNFLGDFEYGFMASTSTYTLLLPVFFKWSHNALIKIPTEIYKVWRYDANYQEPVFTSDTIDKIIVLELELSKKVEEQEYVKVKAKAPLNFSFGEWFQMFIHDHNVKYSESPIQFIQNDGLMYGWIFYVKPTLFKSKIYIDFEKSIEQNGLTQDSMTIVCKRVDYNQ